MGLLCTIQIQHATKTGCGNSKGQISPTAHVWNRHESSILYLSLEFEMHGSLWTDS